MQDEVVERGRTINIIIPEHSLAIGSLQIKQNLDNTELIDESEVYLANQRIIQVWEKKGITDYLRYRKLSSNTTFHWEVVPYSKNSWSFWQQFKVLWNITFGGLSISKKDRQSIAKDFKKTDSTLEFLPLETKSQETSLDVFCTEKVIQKQLVFEGKLINVLYNYAPIGIGQKKLHFLLVPKRHCKKFSDLTKKEYLEVTELSDKLITHYKHEESDQQDLSVYIFDKTGSVAGQTVAHWHQHLVITTTKIQGIWGKLTVLRNMIFGSFPLKAEKLKTRVEELKKNLKTLHSLKR